MILTTVVDVDVALAAVIAITKLGALVDRGAALNDLEVDAIGCRLHAN